MPDGAAEPRESSYEASPDTPNSIFRLTKRRERPLNQLRRDCKPILPQPAKAFVHSFVKEIEVKPGRAPIVYSIPTPDDSPMMGASAAEVALNGGVRKSVRHGGPGRIRTSEGVAGRFTACSLCPLGHRPSKRSRYPPAPGTGPTRRRYRGQLVLSAHDRSSTGHADRPAYPADPGGAG